MSGSVIEQHHHASVALYCFGCWLASTSEACCITAVGTTFRPPNWVTPQLTRLVDEAPTGDDWLHEIKYDGYRMHARIDGDQVKLLTRTGLYWSHRYRRTIEATAELP
jgi:ATP-dependent DNA ligase